MFQHIAKQKGSILRSVALFPAILHSRIFIIAIIALTGMMGFWFAPNDLTPGAYIAQIQVTIDGQPFSIPYSFQMTDSDALTETTPIQIQGYRFAVTGQPIYAYTLGTRLRYCLQVTDAMGKAVPLRLEQATSIIYGNGYSQTVPPTDNCEEGILFSMQTLYRAKVVIAVLLVVAGLWLTELVPLAAGALLIPVVVVSARVSDAETVFQPFAHPIIMLFLASFLMAAALRRSGVDRFIALAILRYASLKPAYLMLTMMIVSAFLAMWMSNTAAVSIVIPIALAILERLPSKAEVQPFRRALILGVAYAAACGGISSAIGSPTNMLALTFLNQYTGTTLTFTDWFGFGLPMTLLMLPVLWTVLWLSFRVRTESLVFNRQQIEEEFQHQTTLHPSARTVLLVFGGVILLWLSEPWHHVSPTIVALGGVIALFFLGVLREEELIHINWNALLTFGGSLSIGTLLVVTGVSDWVALQLVGIASLPVLVIIFLLGSITILTSAVISNTACAAMFIPLVIPLARMLQLDPTLLVAVVAIGASIDFALVVGTPPTMIAYATGLFTTRDIFKRGILLDLLGVMLLSSIVVWIWTVLGLVRL
jgi:sodium-dependent dicarboxylate transporter 2/3/5